MKEGDRTNTRKIWLPVAGLFVLLCIFVCLDEVLDLPRLLGAPATPANWREAVTETVMIAGVGLYVVWKLIRDIAAQVRAEEELRRYRDHLEELVEERTEELTEANRQLRNEITRRKQMEEELRDRERFFSGTLNDMLTFVAVLEPDGEIVFVNNTPLKLIGRGLEDVRGAMFYDVEWWTYAEEARQTIKSCIEQCASGETLIRQIQVQTLDGLIWIEFSMHPMHDPEGNIKYLVPEGRDITDRKRAEEALQEYSERLEEMVEERTGELQVAQEQLVRQEKLAVLGQLAGGVSHELRNPLGVISNAVYFLQMTLSDADETTASPRRIWRSSSSRFSPPRRGASGWDWPSPGSWWRPTGGASRWRVRRGRGAPSL